MAVINYANRKAALVKIKCLSLGSDDGPHFEILSQAGFEVLRADRTRNLWEDDQLIAELRDCAGVIAGSEPYTPKVIEALPELRVIARAGVGFDAVDLAACDARQIVVTTTPGVNHHAVAEHAIALLMGVARGFPRLDQTVRTGSGPRIATPRVMGSTLGLVGLGRIGQAVATRAIGLGMTVLAHDPFANADFVTEHGIALVSFEDLLSQSDYISLHAPVTEQTRELINAETLASMKRGAVLINTSRGGLVDEPALIEALKSGQLRGAGLDVFAVEPLPTDSPLTQMNNVLLAPHVGGLDIESQRDTMIMAAETIVGLHQGKWPEGCVQNCRGVEGWSW